ncbi:MAG: hypothetical protein D6706_08410, partial [Chloroflexi bacterium]
MRGYITFIFILIWAIGHCQIAENGKPRGNGWEREDAYLQASGISDPSKKEAIKRFFRQLRKDTILDKMYALYIFPGPDAQANAVNLVDPSIYRMNFVGNVSHTDTGLVFQSGSYAWVHFKLPQDFNGVTMDVSGNFNNLPFFATKDSATAVSVEDRIVISPDSAGLVSTAFQSQSFLTVSSQG